HVESVAKGEAQFLAQTFKDRFPVMNRLIPEIIISKFCQWKSKYIIYTRHLNINTGQFMNQPLEHFPNCSLQLRVQLVLITLVCEKICTVMLVITCKLANILTCK